MTIWQAQSAQTNVKLVDKYILDQKDLCRTESLKVWQPTAEIRCSCLRCGRATTSVKTRVIHSVVIIEVYHLLDDFWTITQRIVD